MPNTGFRKALPLAFLLLGTAACKSERSRVDESTADTKTTAPKSGHAGRSAFDASAWKVSPQGLGPLHAGMRLSEVESVLPGSSAPADIATSNCSYLRSTALPPGAVLMFSKGVLVRIDILSGRVQSDLGARIGDAEGRLKVLYGSSVRVTPHKYADGHYLTVVSQPDTTVRMIFETDGDRIVRYRSGRIPEVEFVEGCG